MSTVHVLPIGDVVEHTIPGGWDGHGSDACPCCEPGKWLTLEAVEEAPDEPCACAPAMELVPNDDGPDGWLVVHHSLDGRELSEARGGITG